MPDDFNSAISSAVSEATAEVGSEPAADTTPDTTPEPVAAAPAADTTPEPTTEADPKPDADVKPAVTKAAPAVADDDDEEFWNPSAEELAAIDKSPELKKVYRSMAKGFTSKTQGLSQQRKDLAERTKIADWVQANPADAARVLAAATGMTISEAKAEVRAVEKEVDELEAEWAESVGADAAKILRPLFEKTAAKMQEKMLGPIRESQAATERAAQARGIGASVREFGASIVSRGEEWDNDIQNEMTELTKVIEPGENATIDQYLDILYDKVWATRARKSAARQGLDRLRRIKGEQEPVTSVRPSVGKEPQITSDMSERDSIALAVAQARASLRR